jgi:hypothetical protein
MVKSFDLAMAQEALDQFLDNPDNQLQEIKVTCSKTGYTDALIQYRTGTPPFPKKKRRIKRFTMFYGSCPELNVLLEDKKTRLIKMYDFQTESGTIIVVDYQIKEG